MRAVDRPMLKASTQKLKQITGWTPPFHLRKHAAGMDKSDGGRTNVTATKPRVGAVVITPPTFKASGGVSAAIQLTERIAKQIDSALFLMARTTAKPSRWSAASFATRRQIPFCRCGASCRGRPSPRLAREYQAMVARGTVRCRSFHNPHRRVH